MSLLALFEELAASISAATVGEAPALEIQVCHLREFNPTPPTIDMWPSDPQRETFETAAFNDIAGELNISVRARVTTADVPAGQELLLRFMDDDDPICIAGNLMDDQTNAGLTSSVYVDGFSGLQLHDGAADSGPLLGVTWHVRVMRVIT